jgi:hypothetical protein
MEDKGILKILRLLGVVVVLFGLIGLGVDIYAYYKVRPKIQEASARLDVIFNELNDTIGHASNTLGEGRVMIQEFADEGNFSEAWFVPFPNIEQKLRTVADSIDAVESDLVRGQERLKVARDGLLLQIEGLRGLLRLSTIYYISMHAVFIVIGLSLILVENVLMNSSYLRGKSEVRKS